MILDNPCPKKQNIMKNSINRGWIWTIAVPRNRKWWRIPPTDAEVNRLRCENHLKSCVGKLGYVTVLLISFNSTRLHKKRSDVIAECNMKMMSPCFETRLHVTLEAQLFHRGITGKDWKFDSAQLFSFSQLWPKTIGKKWQHYKNVKSCFLE